MKVDRRVLGNIANKGLYDLVNGALGKVESDPHEVEEAQFFVDIERELAHKKKCIIINVNYDD